MRTPQTLPAALIRKLAGLLAVSLLLASTGCMYNNHRNMGATEKFEASDVSTIPKLILFPFVAIGDSLVSPFTMAADQISHDKQYDEDHRFYSYCGSRTIGRSHMGQGWQVYASVPSIIIETFWFIITGPVDLITVLVSGDDEPEQASPVQE